MAAHTKSCRLKLHLDHRDDENRNRRLWFSVDFVNCFNVQDLQKDIKHKLRLLDVDIELFLQDVKIPEWEICSLILRDDDEIVVKLSDSSGVKVTHESEIENVDDNNLRCDAIKSCPKTRKSKKRKLDGDDDDNNTSSKALQCESSRRKPESDEKCSGHSKMRVKKDRVVGEKAAQSEMSESSNSDSDDEIIQVKTSKRDRSAALTPAEIEILASTADMPKPKRHRKHRKKRRTAAETSEPEKKDETSKPEAVVPLNCSYSGKKMVFDSDIEEEAVPIVPCIDNQSLSSSQYDALLEQTLESDSVVEVKPIVQVNLQENLKPQKSSYESPLRNSTIKHKSPAGPIVYKREKVKLRATMSPAILHEILNTSEADTQVPENGEESVPSTSTPLLLSRTNLETETLGHESKIRWNNRKNRSMEKSKNQQLNDVQTNISTVIEYGSSAVAHNHEISQSLEQEKSIVDYSTLEVLHGPPRVGDRVAFKRLEISEDYTPAVSDYKEGTVLAYNAQNKLLHLNLTESSARNKKKRPAGIFDVHIESEDGTLTNIADEENHIEDNLSTFLEMRIVPS